jgi:hypothetical protein
MDNNDEDEEKSNRRHFSYTELLDFLTLSIHGYSEKLENTVFLETGSVPVLC